MSDDTNRTADHDNDIDALLVLLHDGGWKDFHRALTALVAERDELQSKVNAHAEDRRQYIEAWAHWIEFKSALGIEEWLRVYADAVPAPPLDGDEAKRRIYDHLDQRMRDAADMIAALVAERDELKQRVAELEAQPPAASDLRERHDTMTKWMDQVTAMLCHSMTHSHDAKQELVTRCDEAIEAMRKGESRE